MLEYLINLTAYNSWATARIMQSIQHAGDEKSRELLKSSFPTIRQTLLHIYDAQEIWMSRLQGSSPVTGASANFDGNIENVCGLLTGSCNKLQEYVNNLSASSIQSPIDYRNIKGHPFKNSVFEIITHVVNHGTYHRGQLVTMLRTMGVIDLPATDLILYYREPQPA